ncbi:U1 zinc finger-domain-containing protein [Coniochaeta sp. 2T2.1]|nr:U1 zinc finger-domain-containing protein [Coniochaeta sp. 2T2.1]
MPKFFCDYCDVYLTHDSMSVRKAHNSGRNHLRNVVDYYQQIGHEKAQSVIDSITSSYAAEGQAHANPMLPQNQPGAGRFGASPFPLGSGAPGSSSAFPPPPPNFAFPPGANPMPGGAFPPPPGGMGAAGAPPFPFPPPGAVGAGAGVPPFPFPPPGGAGVGGAGGAMPPFPFPPPGGAGVGAPQFPFPPPGAAGGAPQFPFPPPGQGFPPGPPGGGYGDRR